MALKPSQGISRYLTRPHKATNRARLMLICINQCMYNFQQNFILPSSCSTQLLLNQSMQFFISHTKTLASWPLPPQVVHAIVKCHCISGNVATKTLWSCLNNSTFHPLLTAPFHSISFSLQLRNSLLSMSSLKHCLTSSLPFYPRSVFMFKILQHSHMVPAIL